MESQEQSGQGVRSSVHHVAFKNISTIRLYIDLSESNNKTEIKIFKAIYSVVALGDDSR